MTPQPAASETNEFIAEDSPMTTMSYARILANVMAESEKFAPLNEPYDSVIVPYSCGCPMRAASYCNCSPIDDILGNRTFSYRDDEELECYSEASVDSSEISLLKEEVNDLFYLDAKRQDQMDELRQEVERMRSAVEKLQKECEEEEEDECEEECLQAVFESFFCAAIDAAFFFALFYIFLVYSF
uniref:Thyroglobulin type-1 domain-containing protein n=1 Tax=Steinernema glaseri TaxID=37863 RepID=A0A1I8AWF8_9BILA